MWLAIDLAVLVLAIVLVVVLALHAYSRFRRMNRFGRRASERLSVLADDAGQLGERVDGLADHAESVDERTRDLAETMAAGSRPRRR